MFKFVITSGATGLAFLGMVAVSDAGQRRGDARTDVSQTDTRQGSDVQQFRDLQDWRSSAAEEGSAVNSGTEAAIYIQDRHPNGI